MTTFSSPFVSNKYWIQIYSTSKFQSPLLIKSNAVRFKPASAKRDSSGSDFENGLGLVDENMITLRERIQNMEVAGGKDEPPPHWMEWEKRYFTKYRSDVCEFVGLVQTVLMKTRPALAIGLVGFMAISLPTSTVLTLLRLVNAVKMGATGTNAFKCYIPFTRLNVFSVLQAVLAGSKEVVEAADILVCSSEGEDRCSNTRTLIFYLVLLSYL